MGPYQILKKSARYHLPLNSLAWRASVFGVRYAEKWMAAERVLSDEGMTIIEQSKNGPVTKVHPMQKVATDEQNKAVALLREYGFTPCRIIRSVSETPLVDRV